MSSQKVLEPFFIPNTTATEDSSGNLIYSTTKTIQADGTGLLVKNLLTGTSLGIGSQVFQLNGSINIDPLNLTAIAPNPTPQELVINNTILVQDANSSPNNVIGIQSGVIGVGTNFGIEYGSTTNQDFTIQTTNYNTGGVVFKQYGAGANTTQTKIKQGTITSTDGTSTSTITPTSITATTFNGNLNGTATSATTATNATNVATTSTSTNATYYPTFVSATSGNNGINVDTTLTYNPSSDTLTCANFAGTATSATTATNIAGGLGGYIPYQSAVNTTALLANGTSGQYLKSNGTTNAPSWATLPTTATPTLSAVMTAGNTASTTLNMSGNNITNCGAITSTTSTDLIIQGWSGNGTTAGSVNIQSNDNSGFAYQGIVNVNADTTYQAYLQGTINAGSPLGSQFGVNYTGFTCNGIYQNPILNGANNGTLTSLTIQPSITINNPSGNPTISGQNNGSSTSLIVSTGVNTPSLTLSNLGQPTIVGQNTGNYSSIQVPYGFLDNILLASTSTGTITLSTTNLYNQNYFTGNGAITLKLPSTSLQPNGTWLGICFAPNSTTARTMTIQNSGGTTISVLTSGTTAYSAGTSATCVRMVISGGNWYCF
jgi:hypothetical protein